MIDLDLQRFDAGHLRVKRSFRETELTANQPYDFKQEIEPEISRTPMRGNELRNLVAASFFVAFLSGPK